MHIRKYTDGWSRREFMERTAKGIFAAGLLQPLWPLIGRHGDCSAAYPPELLSISEFTKGKAKAGDILDASNIDLFKDIVDPFMWHQVKDEGRTCELRDTTTDIYRLNPKVYIDATLKNKGMAVVGADQNVWTKDGKPWIGGNPFPEPQTALEVLLGHTIAGGRHDSSFYPIREWDMDKDGYEMYHYHYLFIEFMMTGRLVLEPKPYYTGYENVLRVNTIYNTLPSDQAGTVYMNNWPYDQNKFPDFYGYLPAFKRTRTFPTDQRFEPIFPGSNFFITDAWMTGDPILTWGNFKLVGKGPLLTPVANCWDGDKEDWQHERVGGKTGKRFFKLRVEIVPETYVVEYEPTKYPRAPYSKKKIWFDARTLTPLVMVDYDRQGKVWKQWEGSFDLYDNPQKGIRWPEKGDPFWSWTHVHNEDMQSHTMTILNHSKSIQGGFQAVFDDPSIREKWCSVESLTRLGR